MTSMPRSRFLAGLGLMLSVTSAGAAADAVLDWNTTLRTVIQSNIAKANPGLSTRSMAMTNGALYDVTMGFGRTHVPFRVTDFAPAGASREAAYAKAAYDTILNAYPEQQGILDADLATRLALIPDGPAKTDGILYGAAVAKNYTDWRMNDGSSNNVPYVPVGGPGHWTPDPFHPTQQAWGPTWGSVQTYTLNSSSQFSVPGPPDMTSQAYTDAYNQVRDKGALVGHTRTQDETDMGIFWAYDRPTMGPPPVLFSRNLEEVSLQMGNTVEQNARLFAMASMAMADASIAAWDVKFDADFWRPVTAIQQADSDGNPNTIQVDGWRPFGAPGSDPNDFSDDFTPPFPAYVSGHATFGGALYEVLRDFYGVDGVNFDLTSQEMQGNNVRSFTSFSQAEYENAISRVYLGIHWIFDAEDGIALGNDIADWVGANHFQAVPEPGTWTMVVVAGLAAGIRRWRRK